MKGVISSSLISSVEAASNSSCTNTSTKLLTLISFQVNLKKTHQMPRFLDGHSVSLSLIFMVKLEAGVVNLKPMDMAGVLNPEDGMKVRF